MTFVFTNDDRELTVFNSLVTPELVYAPIAIPEKIWNEMYLASRFVPKNGRDYEYDVNRVPTCCAFCIRMHNKAVAL